MLAQLTLGAVAVVLGLWLASLRHRLGFIGAVPFVIIGVAYILVGAGVLQP
jgi:hypothetical protein